jgi:hypothetical protein
MVNPGLLGICLVVFLLLGVGAFDVEFYHAFIVLFPALF